MSTKKYHITPIQYLNELLLEESKFLLETERELLISQVANLVGLEDNYFIRLFRGKYGTTPGAYRSEFLNRCENE